MESAAERKLNDAASIAAGFLGAFGRVAAERKREDLTFIAIMRLEDAGRINLKILPQVAAVNIVRIAKRASENKFESVTKHAPFYLLRIGKTAVENSYDYEAKQVAKSLAELTLLNEGTVKATIQDYKLGLEEEERHSFPEFMTLYEAELEKLRAKQQE